MDLNLLYRDTDLIICDKPPGLSSESPGLPDLLQSQFHIKTFPVHRLDRGTGGVIVLALSPESCRCLQQLFLADLVRKDYLCVVSGKPDRNEGSFSDYLYHDPQKNKSYVVSQKRKGVRDAFCEWKLLSAVQSQDQMFSLIRVTLHTGRTHQIRVQFASRGFPLIGDRRYGSRFKVQTPALWAERIRFPHPSAAGKIVSAVSDPPLSFPWNLFITAGGQVIHSQVGFPDN